VNEPRRSFWGWGLEGVGATESERALIAAAIRTRMGVEPGAPERPPRIDDLRLRRPRITPPGALAAICSTDPYDRALHAYGRSYRDVVRGFRGLFPNPPDVVAYPRDEADIVRLLDHCSSAGIAAIPFGGGTSVVGGVEPAVGEAFAGTLTIDLSRLAGVLKVDERSRAVRVQAGALGPSVERVLAPLGLSMRHYPQSFEFSTVGGWIATRASGHHATLRTHVDDLVESLRIITPAGTLQTRRLPASGAGPAPDRLFIGSEGALGIVTEAWLRVQPRPRWRSSAAVRFGAFADGTGAARALAQSGMYPANCRLLDPTEALLAGAGDGSGAVLLVAFESADHPQEAALTRAVECARDLGGEPAEIRHRGPDDAAGPGGSAGAWRGAFLRAPYLRDVMVAMGMITETFETAVTWDRSDALDDAVLAAAEAGLRDAGAWPAIVTRRFTHVYADGPAPYYTVIAPGRRGSEIGQWDLAKTAVSDAIVASGGTITHHHAVGRDHRPWYDRERPDLFARGLGAAKAVLDPSWIMNPGVLVDPP
jgi:alkyldihydroxyacetonephosphate synthase